MKINKKNIQTLFLTVFVTLIFFASCFNINANKKFLSQNSVEYGYLSVNPQSERALDKPRIVKADITISSDDMTDIKKTNIDLVNGAVSNVQITGIPVGKNRVITVEAKQLDNSNPTKIDGVVIRQIIDIEPGPNGTTINWESTAKGNVFYSLLKDHSYNISEMPDEERATLLTLIANARTAAGHDSLVNASAIAADFKNNDLKAANTYIIAPATLTFNIESVYTDLEAQITDPYSTVLASASTSSQNTIQNITPGKWVFWIKNNGSIAYQNELTLTAGQTLDLSTIILSSELGYTYPQTGAFSPVDSNGSTAGFGWSNGNWDLGAHKDGNTVSFAVYSKNATKVLLEIYDAATGADALYDYWMEKGSDNIWRAKINNVPEHTLYAFRVWGPNWTFNQNWKRGNSAEGFISDMHATDFHRFNPNKVLFDPYARELSHDTETPAMIAAGHDGGMYGTGSTLYKSVARRNYDTGKWAPKSVFVVDSTSTGTKPNIAQKDAIIYEAHVRGLTQHESSSNLETILSGLDGFDQVVNVPTEYRGTYKGAAYMAPYLKAIGINTIELLPVHETLNDIDGGNFWGYMTYGFFAPDRKYSYDKTYGGPTKEFKEMVKSFHDAGIEVYLDVVYNHTGEGGNWGDDIDTTGFTSLGGFDVTEYYHVIPSGVAGATAGWLVDGATGCGNQVNANNDALKKLVLDSLDYWIDDMGVDGFRFDLAATLGRYANQHSASEYWDNGVKNFDSGHPLITGIASKATTKNVKIIAEAWDMWGYPVGNFPAPWAEWNGRFRDAARKYLKGDPQGHAGVSYIDAFNGDYAHFYDQGQGGPHKSINLLVAHDGFTLADLVSYNAKQNATLTEPFGPSDGGADNNDSWDSGGDKALRRQRLRNFWVFQMFARGTPMIVYGDELARTQNGNNNPYNLDKVITWNNYNMIASNTPQTVATGHGGAYHNNLGTYGSTQDVNGNFVFSSFVMNLRKNSQALRQASYALPIEYKKEDGTSSLGSGDRCVWIRIKGSTDNDTDYLIFSNMYTAKISFAIPAAPSGKSWKRIIDTQSYFETNFNFWSDDDAETMTGTYGVEPWSMVVLKLLDGSGGGTPDPTDPDPDPSKVTLKMTKDVGDGNELYFTGNFVEGNEWKTAIRGTWTDGNVWEVEVTPPSGGNFEWKTLKGTYIADNGTALIDGSLTWESGSDHNQGNLHPGFNGGF